MKRRYHSLGAGLAMVSMLGMLAPANVAVASSKGRKNTAIGLGAAAAQQLLNGKTTNGIVLGAGAAYAYKRYKDSEREEQRNRRASTYRSNTYSSNNRSNSRYGSASTRRSSQVRQTRSGAASTTNSRLVFTGRITDDTDFTNRRLTVTSNGVERRLHVPDTTPVFQAGQQASVHDVREGDIVRVSAVRASATEWKALRIDVTSSAGIRSDRIIDRDRVGYDDRAYDRNDRASDRGSRYDTAREYSGVGIVREIDVDNRSIDIEVGGNIRTVYTTGARYSGIRSMSELRRGDRVRVRGNLDGRDVNAAEVSLLD